ncbi:MAG: Ada metal-binding domain-containing protein [Parcubacteria group bacterium]
MENKIKDFLKANEPKIALFIGFVLVAGISFEFGLIQGKKQQNKPLIIEKSILGQNVESQVPSASPSQAQNLATEAKITPDSTNTPPQSCTFVGSKNSNKYHLPTCHFAKLIKPENLVCFKSAEDAQSRGYQPDKNCVK